MRTHSALKTIVLALVSFIVVGVHAQESTSTVFPKIVEAEPDAWRPHLGLQAGYSNPEDNYDPTVEYGLDAGFQPVIPFGYGAELTFFSSDGPADQDMDRLNLMVKGTYNFGGDIQLLKLSYVGVGAGAVWDSIGDTDNTNFGFAPMAGFDYPIGDREERILTLGVKAKYLIVGGNSLDSFSLNGLMKYWF